MAEQVVAEEGTLRLINECTENKRSQVLPARMEPAPKKEYKVKDSWVVPKE